MRFKKAELASLFKIKQSLKLFEYPSRATHFATPAVK